MSETLQQAERRICATLTPPERAKRLFKSLGETVEEVRRLASCALTPASRELWAMEAERIEQARECLRVLEQEQWRQRESAKLFLHGQIRH